MATFLGTRIPYPNMNCHPDRSVAKWRDLLFSPPATDAHESVALPFVIPSLTDLSRDTALDARSRRTSRMLISPMLFGAFKDESRACRVRQVRTSSFNGR